MEHKKSHRSRRQRGHPQNSEMESKALKNIRSQIDSLTTVSGLTIEPQEFNERKKKEAEPEWNRTVIRRMKNIDLYTDDCSRNMKRRSIPLEEYADDHEIIADIRTTNAGVSHSNQRLERLWGGNDRSLESSMSSDCDKSKSELSSNDGEEEKYKKNVLFSWLLKQRREQAKNEDKLDKPVENENSKYKSHSNVSHIIRDSEDPDFYYRQKTATNPETDYTVEHVGKVNVVRARKYLIDNFNDDDIVFCQRNSRRSVFSNNDKRNTIK